MKITKFEKKNCEVSQKALNEKVKPFQMSSRERDSRSRSRSRGVRGGRSSSGSPPDRRRGRSRDRSDSRFVKRFLSQKMVILFQKPTLSPSFESLFRNFIYSLKTCEVSWNFENNPLAICVKSNLKKLNSKYEEVEKKYLLWRNYANQV